jgi:hypothetical protein
LTKKYPKNCQKFKFFKKNLEINKYHKITYLCAFSCKLSHLWGQNGHFLLIFGTILPLLLYREIVYWPN